MFKLSSRSIRNLSGVHPLLCTLAYMSLSRSPFDFGITSGVRTVEQQKELVAAGRSQTMKSNHLTGHAFDIVVYVDGKVTWDLKFYEAVSEVIKECAAEIDESVQWGGDWTSFIDGPHFQLDPNQYKFKAS